MPFKTDRPLTQTVPHDTDGNELSWHEGDVVSGINVPGIVLHGIDKTEIAHHGHMIQDPDDTTVHRLQTEARIAPGSRVSVVPLGIGPADLGNLFRQFLTTDGTPTGPSNMVVDGSSTPVVFYMNADATLNTVLTEIRFTFTANSIGWNSSNFGKGSGQPALPNGVTIELTANGGTYVDFGTVTINEELLMLPVRNSVVLAQGGNRDVIALSIDLGGLAILEAGTADCIKVTINDNLTIGSRDINYFKFAAYGIKVSPS